MKLEAAVGLSPSKPIEPGRWKLSFMNQKAILLVHVSGAVSHLDWDSIIKEAVRKAKSLNCWRHLVDCREAILSSLLIDLAERPNTYPGLGLDRAARIAVMFPHGFRERWFAEIVHSNHGYNLKTFDAESEAVEWLTAKPVPRTAAALDDLAGDRRR